MLLSLKKFQREAGESSEEVVRDPGAHRPGAGGHL